MRGTKQVNQKADSSNAANGMTAGALISCAVVMLALPSAVLAFAVDFGPGTDNANDRSSAAASSASEEPAALTRAIAIRSLARGQLYPFTPASSPDRGSRSITVAVRVDPETARAISAQQAGGQIAQPTDKSQLAIAPTAFSLGVSRGYSNFAQALVGKDKKSKSALPDLAKFSIAAKGAPDDSRFSPRIVMDETQSAGRAPRTFAGDSDDLVDVGGSYRVTKNLDVTAGVRYAQERERLVPVTDGKQDSQAVYVGTQFRF